MASSGQIKVINVRPGINKNEALYQSEGTYVSSQWTRFQNGNPKKMGGWQVLNPEETYRGIARDSLSWNDLQGEALYAVGTNSGLFIYNGQQFYDITPVRLSVVQTSVFSTTLDSLQVKASVTNFDSVAGDFVAISSVTFSGLTLNGVYEITSANNDTFTFNATTTANATGSQLGDTTSLSFLIPTGLESNGATGGWGSGPWGGSGGGWGAGVTNLPTILRTWTLDTWGEDLIANYNGGGIYVWDRTFGLGTRAVQISGAPTEANSINVINPPRILCAYGTSAYLGPFDPLLVRWSSNEDYSEFNPAVTNASGELRLQDGNEITQAIDSKDVTLILTDTGAYAQSYIGGDFVFSITKVGAYCGSVGPHAGIDVNGIVYWMGHTAFYSYNGVVQQLPCTLSDNLFNKTYGDGLNIAQATKVYCGVNNEFSEIIWLYPSRDSQECNRYVIYNVDSGLWYDGTLVRTTWNDATVFSRPLATGVNQDTFNQEYGTNADGLELPALLYTGYFDIDDGTTLFLADQFIPDLKNQSGVVTVQFSFKKFPQSSEEFVKGPFNVTNTPLLNFRGKGRQMEIRWACSGVDSNYQIGRHRLRLAADGLR